MLFVLSFVDEAQRVNKKIIINKKILMLWLIDKTSLINQ